MTGSLEKGARRAGQQFNRVVQRLEQIEAVPPGFFPVLAEDVSLDEVGIASLQLASYLDDTEEHIGKERVEPPLFGSLVISQLGSLEELEKLRALRHNPTDMRRPRGMQATGNAQPDSDQSKIDEALNTRAGRPPMEH